MRGKASLAACALAFRVLSLEAQASARDISNGEGNVGTPIEAPRTSPATDVSPEKEPETDDEIPDDDAFGPRSNLRTRAEQVSFDARERTLELSGNVRIDSPPFHLRSPRIKLTRTRLGIELVGKGSLAFCPCLGTPLKVDFDEAVVAPPGDFILKNPTLRVYNVPILPLPYFWLRSDDKAGALPPEIAYRGQDGLFVGAGAHVPWRQRGEKRALDVRFGAYLFRGIAAEVRFRTPSSVAKLRYDRLPAGAGVTPGNVSRDDGLFVDARGAVTNGELGLAWDADVVRGARGVASTTDLDAASQRWDRASAEAALRSGPLVVATSMRAVARRGGALTNVDAVGPVATVRSSGAAFDFFTYDTTLEGGSLRLVTPNGTPNASPNGASSESSDAMSFARAEAGGHVTTSLSVFEVSLALRFAANVAARGRRRSGDRAESVRALFKVPLGRRFGSAESGAREDARDPWLHVVEPFAEAAAVHATGDGMFGLSPARGAFGINGSALIAHAGLVSTLGRWGARDALELSVSGGGVGGGTFEASRMRPVARARAAGSTAWLGVSADAARAFVSSLDDGTGEAFAVVARLRLGPRDGLHLSSHVASRGDLDPVLARALVDAPLEPAAGFLTDAGTTGGAGIVVPWSRWVTTSAGADFDITRRELVGARAGLELSDRCGCLTLRVLGAHRLGRDGVDVGLALDFASDR